MNNTIGKKTVIALAISLSAANLARADGGQDYYSYHPRGILTLGGGFSPNNMSQAKIKCLDFKVKAAPSETGALETSLKSYILRNAQEMKETMKIDFSIEASYLTAKANAGMNLETSRMFKSDSVTMMTFAETEYGRMEIAEATLNEHGQALIKAKGNDFEKECGTHLVRMIRKGARVAVFVTLHNLTEEQKHSLMVEAGGGASYGAASFSAKARFQQLLEQSRASNSVDIQVTATGGQGIAPLSDFVKALQFQPDTMNRIESAVAEYMKTFNQENAAPIGFHAAPFGFGYVQGERIWDTQFQRKLARLANKFGELYEEIEDIRHALEEEDPRKDFLTPTDVELLERVIDQLELLQDNVAEAHSKCMSTVELSACTMPKGQIPPYRLPALPERPTLLPEPSTASIRKTDLEIQGEAIARYRVVLNDTIVTDERVERGALAGSPIKVDLSNFWQSRRSRLRGMVTGRIVATDHYGRSTTYTFYRAMHSEQGSVHPYSEEYSRYGKL